MKIRLIVAASIAAFALATPASAETTLTVMTFNVYGGGANDGKPVDETVAAIKAAGADIVGMQETRLESDPCEADYCPPAGDSVAKAIAEKLGFYYYDQAKENPALWANAILSRYPIGPATPNDTGVKIDVDGRTVYAPSTSISMTRRTSLISSWTSSMARRPSSRPRRRR